MTPDQRPAYADEAEIRGIIDQYADELKASGAIASAAVERAFRMVERHRLLETFYHWDGEGFETLRHDPAHSRRDHLALIYADTALATRRIGGLPASSTSQASLVARMLELLELGEGMKVLEVGAGTGYNAALMAEIVGDQRLVVTVDVLEDVVDQTRRLLAGAGYPQIQVLLRDGFEGVPEQAPFDRMVATVGCSDLSPHWAEQLAPGGAMLVPLEQATGHPLVLIRKQGGALRGRMVLRTGFIPVRGPLHIEDLWTQGGPTNRWGSPTMRPTSCSSSGCTTAGRAGPRRAPRSANWTAGPRWLPTGSGGGRTRPWPVSSTGVTGTGTRAAGRRSRITSCRSCRSAPSAIRHRGPGP